MSAQRPGTRKRIVVVDDDEFMRELLGLHLTNAGYEVLVAEDAVAAGHLVVRSPPDLLIVDVRMPYMSGYEFVRAVKDDPDTRHIPVVLLSSEDDLEQHAAQLGASGCLRKPVKADRLLEIVARLTAGTAGGLAE